MQIEGVKMRDIQSEEDTRAVPLTKVGVKGVAICSYKDGPRDYRTK